MDNRKISYGFTLLEILVAIFVFGIIMTALFSSFNAVSTTTEAVDRGISSYETAKDCMKIIVNDLQSIYVSMPPAYVIPAFNSDSDPFRIEGETRFDGDAGFSKLRFTSHEHISFENKSDKGIAEIIYYIHEPDDGDYVLKRSDNLQLSKLFEPKDSDPVLCENVKSLVFRYFDDEGEVYDAWDSDSDEHGYSTPQAIGIKLEIGDDYGSFHFETKVALKVFRKKT
ncbi:MAG: prepilin-type N-terminal cleavage/methylation domain-containing protein [Desulfobacterales bacterium]|nr:prepilin-type N-terminal cleavage/methylation domain-containing protein [Desulfobacteraceae bacterium]MBT4364979.1 prepilin-type N-terminal cleavage/methylation domain-containing protein [Desulfobacteraceae bacterium]MBT7084563.1 prepilin-type N-terminal cleavage/methylation domain-containing protein [Desulfobacterales bacterium]